MQPRVSIVVTSISKPNKALLELSEGCNAHGYRFIVIGDVSSPADFHIQGCDFYSLEQQIQTGLEYAALCPTRHYARKNIGYLLAIQNGTNLIIDTDDDNIPYDAFWARRQRKNIVPAVEEPGWLNVYRYFSSANIWPRGFPLNRVNREVPSFGTLSGQTVDSPIQQGLANENPDVDAIYRLILPLPLNFMNDRQIALGKGTWCPFNSQNTIWWEDAFPLLYLPSYCSFRMTDIWRSFVAQRIAWENDWAILFREATVWQERNEHNLMKDFTDEIPGYLYNESICDALGKLSLKEGTQNIIPNLRLCYEKLIDMKIIGADELKLLEAWINDLKNLSVTL